MTGVSRSTAASAEPEPEERGGGVKAEFAGPEPPHWSANVHFEDREAFEAFRERVEVDLYETTASFWYFASRRRRPPRLEGRRGMTFDGGPALEPDPSMAEPETDLFGRPTERWREHWRGMPAFEMEDRTAWKTVAVHFPDAEALEAFRERVLDGEDFYHGKWTWWPPSGYERWSDRVWVGGPSEPRYPVYVISKGRAEKQLTSNALDRMGVPHRVVVEPQEADAYREHLNEGTARLLVLPFRDLGRGSIPARNYVWVHAEELNSERHWILDDNLDGFYRLHRNAKRLLLTGAPFRAAEDWVDRYRNVAIAGFQYESFAMRREEQEPYRLNTRIYSCILLKNDLPFRWRGKYNEDTDLSLRVLKDGRVTVLFNAFLANKVATGRMSGGNTDEVYAETDERREFAEALREQHPDVVEVTRKWGRWHHEVDYSRFARNRLRRREDAPAPEDLPGRDEYGMRLVPREEVEEREEGEPEREPEPGPEERVRRLLADVEEGGEEEGEDVRRPPVPATYRGDDVWEEPGDEQRVMFEGVENDWRREYRGMPEYRHRDEAPLDDVTVTLRVPEGERERRKQYNNPQGGPEEGPRLEEELAGHLFEDGDGPPPPSSEEEGEGERRTAVKVNFADEEDRAAFARLLDLPPYEVARREEVRFDGTTEEFSDLVGQTVYASTDSIWHPEADVRRMANKAYRVPEDGRREGRAGGRTAAPPPRAALRRPPLYVVSKGRWETRFTSDWLNEAGVPHFVVVEPQEAAEYRRHVGELTTVLELDMSYKERYDTVDDLGLSKSTGPGPARNFAWDHAAEVIGSDWHWVMDDNLQGFYRYNDNLKVPCSDGTVLRCMEDFAARYENVLMAGPRYFMFCSRKAPQPPLTFNTRIYSCNLIRNDAPYRWRGRYNEDTDLALRMLKDGHCTLLFGAFLQYKTPTQELEGGNTGEFYEKEGTKPKSEILERMHPDVASVVWKWGRWHHHVDYGPFKGNLLRRKPGVEPARLPVIDNYGMELFVDGAPVGGQREPARVEDAGGEERGSA